MSKPRDTAFPSHQDQTKGMSFFEYVAIQCTQGLLASGNNPDLASTEGIEAANYLIEKLAEERFKT